MNKKTAALICLLALAGIRVRAQGDTTALLGRWDITVHAQGRDFASWLEVYRSGSRFMVGRFVGGGGSSRPISRVNLENGKLRFSIPPQWESEDRNLDVEASMQGDSLVGTMVTPSSETLSWVGYRAPALKRRGKPVWGKSITLFNGKDLSGWHVMGKTNQWAVEDGVLRSPLSGSNIVTDQKFADFKLHIEFRCPKGGNSGVYLRGRYEVQIEDEEGRVVQPSEVISAVYGFLSPIEQVSKGPGVWQTYDITLVGRLVTIVFNGKTVICLSEIPGITGGALDCHEGEPGPIFLQGDHRAIEYRNIILTPAR
ncbi:MAG: large multifunctional protein- glycosyl hydrolase [Sphingobacteriales bacterium 50-39]|nr:DUF1080 domain-containing protein [Sphingobacteriales bacterium]OJW53129.1 MAG: large multifunctional protein- glycosyl hydrolase [Sphingobacteriales bacterium 50-39]